METLKKVCTDTGRHYSPADAEDAFSRLDESDDRVFYGTDRFVNHIDAVALNTVKQLIETLIVEENPVILDLMAGWDSHLPGTLNPSRVIGPKIRPPRRSNSSMPG